MNAATFFLLLSALALLLSKAADFHSTIKHVGMEGESNPFARRCFERFGFRGGLAIVATVWLLIAVTTYGYAWLAGGPVTHWATALLGFVIAWVQWDAARFNRTGRASGLIRLIFQLYKRWR